MFDLFFLRHYQKGLRLDPEHGELKKAYFGLKNLLKKTKSVSKNVFYTSRFSKVSKRFSDSSLSLMRLMQAEDNASKGKLRLAVEEYRAALALDPNHSAHNVNLHLGLCKVLVKLGRGSDAVSSCSEALEIDGELVEALVQVFLFSWAHYSLNF